MSSSPPSQNVNLVFSLEGDVADVSVFALAPAMLSLGALIRDSSKTLHPMAEPVAVNVRAFKPGSFMVDIVLFAQTLDGQQILAAGAMNPNTIVHVLKTIGLLVDVKSSVLDVIKKLRGNPAKVEQVRPGEFQYSAGDTSITVSGEVHQLVQSQHVVQHIHNVYAQPLADPRVTAVKSFAGSEGEKTAVRIDKSDLPAIQAFSARQPGADRSEVSVSTVLLKPKRVDVDGDRARWTFRRGKSVLQATIRDDEFLERVKSAEIRIAGTDLLRVELQVTQHVDGFDLTESYEILKVIEYLKDGSSPPRFE